MDAEAQLQYQQYLQQQQQQQQQPQPQQSGAGIASQGPEVSMSFATLPKVRADLGRILSNDLPERSLRPLVPKFKESLKRAESGPKKKKKHGILSRLIMSLFFFGPEKIGDGPNLRSGPGKPNQGKGQNEKFMNFAHFFVKILVFFLRRQARFTSRTFVPEYAPAKSSWTDLFWFGLPGPLLRIGFGEYGFKQRTQ